jgi:hypothetical protein
MNNNLLNVIKEITAQYGESVLSEPKRVSAFFADLAREEPKPQKTALVKCLELGFAQTFKNVPENERGNCKQKLAQRLHDEEGLDFALCEETLDLLAAVLFGEQKEQKNMCKNCGKELQEGWKACPFCGAAVENQSIGSAISAISSGSGGAGYGVSLIEPIAGDYHDPHAEKSTSGAGQVILQVFAILGLSSCFGVLSVFLAELGVVVVMIGFVLFIGMMIFVNIKITNHFANKNKSANKKS